MVEDEYVEKFKPFLMDVVFDWCNGSSFLEICKKTDIFEGKSNIIHLNSYYRAKYFHNVIYYLREPSHWLVRTQQLTIQNFLMCCWLMFLFEISFCTPNFFIFLFIIIIIYLFFIYFFFFMVLWFFFFFFFTAMINFFFQEASSEQWGD